MARLFLVLIFVGVVIGAAMLLGRAITAAQEVPVPKTAKTVSYILLILLMLGVVTGWLGGL